MFDSQYPDSYFAYGESALHHIQHALSVISADPPREILDMPCGHGRVLRALQAAYPAAHLTACDIERDGVDFCVNTFSARGVYAMKEPAEVGMDATFDLIWVGSLLTHLGVNRWHTFFAFFLEHLVAGGLLVFSTHGRYHAESLRANKTLPAFTFLVGESRAELLGSYDRHGFAYRDYPGTEGYGLSLSTPSWVIRTLRTTPSFG